MVRVNSSTSGCTDVAPSANYVAGEVDRATFCITNAATLRLVSDFTVGDIWLQSAGSVLDLGLKTLTVHSKQHELGLGTVINPGSIIWMPDTPGPVYSTR